MGILSGALRGVGSYLVEQARAQREAALEQLRQDRLDQRQEIATQDTFKAQELNDQRQSDNRMKELAVSHGYQSQMQDDRQQFEREQQQSQQQQALSLEEVRHRYRMSEQQAQITGEAMARAAQAGQSVIRTEINEAGQLVGYNGRGEEVMRTDAEFTPPAERSQGNSTRRNVRPRPAATRPATVSERPPVPGARRARDGNWYVQRGSRFFRVEGQ